MFFPSLLEGYRDQKRWKRGDREVLPALAAASEGFTGANPGKEVEANTEVAIRMR